MIGSRASLSARLRLTSARATNADESRRRLFNLRRNASSSVVVVVAPRRRSLVFASANDDTSPSPTATSPAPSPPTVDDDAEDLLQFPDRARWYVAKFAADDAPDWNACKLLSSEEIVAGAVKLVTVEAEVSRERVPLRNAYLTPGQRARVRVLGGGECSARVASPPPFPSVNHDALVAARNDIKANETKEAREPTSALAKIQLWVTEDDAPDLWSAKVGESLLELGPFEGTGVDLKAVAGAFAFPTVVMFVSGEGVAAARALLAASPDAGGLVLRLRRDVVVYYKAPNARSMAFADELESEWARRAAEAGGWHPNNNSKNSSPSASPSPSFAGPRFRVVTATRGESFAEMFDDDDELEYEPSQTCCLIFTGARHGGKDGGVDGDDFGGASGGGGGKKSEKQEQAEADEKDALEAAAAAEISVVVRGDVDADPVVHTETAKI